MKTGKNCPKSVCTIRTETFPNVGSFIGKRIPKYKGINKHSTAKGRREAAEELKQIWLERLSGRVEGFKGTAVAPKFRTII